MMTVYYAHSVRVYGSAQEQRDIATLERLGLSVLNPNTKGHEMAYQKIGMAHFEFVVKGCDALAFRANSDGTINCGVAQEIEWAVSKEIPVFELPAGISQRVLTREQTKEVLRESGVR